MGLGGFVFRLLGGRFAGIGWTMDFYFDSYGELNLHRTMVSDRPRTDAFAKAIAEVVKSGDRVLDVGTGTGLLAMLSAKAGASQAYGIDQATIAETAERLVEHNGLSDTIRILKGNASELRLEEPVDLIVSEWLGHFAFVESMLDDVIAARDANLKSDGLMLPSGVELLLAPISAPWIYEENGPGFWRNAVHGIDYTPLEKEELKQAIAGKSVIDDDCLLAQGHRLVALDLKTAKAEDPWVKGEVEFEIQEDGELDGFIGWFNAQLSPSVLLDTGPGSEPTHWGQTHLPVPPRSVARGEKLKAKFAIDRHPADERSIEFRLEVDGETLHYKVG